jgi:Ran GTPase-activating protein (RanGAP) involved in mRNA processing and transport
VITIPAYYGGIASVTALYSIMSDTDSDADPISDTSNTQVDHDDGAEAFPISPNIRVLCDRLRSNDSRVLNSISVFTPFKFQGDNSEGENVAVFQALKQNTSVKHIGLWSNGYTKRSAKAAAQYLASSQTLQKLHMWYDVGSSETPEAMALLFQALSRNTSVTELSVGTESVGCASVAFQELLTNTQTLHSLAVIRYGFEDGELNEVQTAAITSGFANNTTLRDLKFYSWREVDLVPVLTALQYHPALQKIHFRPAYCCSKYLPSLSGLDVLLRSQDSKVTELIIEGISHTSTIGLHAVMRELGRNTRLTNVAIHKSALSRENVQQLKSMLQRNTVLESLVLTRSRLGSAGLAEIAPVLYRNTSIKTLDLTNNGLHDIESANLLRELIRRNKTITSLCIANNAFHRNAAAVRSIANGVRSNTKLQQLGLRFCGLGDQGISVLANALAIRNASLLELDLGCNQITSAGVHALVDDNVKAMKTLTKLCLSGNLIRSEGATILADALGRSAMPSLKQLDLDSCRIDDDGFVALVSVLEQNTSLQILDLKDNSFGGRGFMALAASLPTIKGLQQLHFTAYTIFQSTTLPLLLEGFRKNTSLVKVTIVGSHVTGDFLQEIKFLGHRNRFTPLLKASDPPGSSQQLGIWSRGLAKMTTEPDVLFHVLRNKPKLVGSAGGSKKRKRDDE